MINPPFPYKVTISRRAVPSDPFAKVDDDWDNATVVYEGECDFENNRYPLYRDGVQVGKYKLYLPDNTTPVEKKDLIKLSIYGRTIWGEIADFFPTNFGLTVSWDSANN